MKTRSPRYRAALALARAAAWASRRLLHRSGSVIGGAVLLRLAPGGLAQLARQRRITFVSGTNGKSTTTAMIVAALRRHAQVATNAEGANTPHGLAWVVATASGDEVVLEVDESWLPWAVRSLHPQTVVLLNLSRDQLHRKPELRPLAKAWREALGTVPRVVANAEDPAVVWAASVATDTTYVGGIPAWADDAVLCPACGELLQDLALRWHCTCGLARPTPTVTVRAHEIVGRERVIGHYDALPGDANLINAAAAVAAVSDVVPAEEALEAISSDVHEVAGRYHELTVAGRRVRLLLAKNPAGWAATLGMLRRGAATLISFSADGIDGRDTSWLYDVDFALLRGRPVAVTGSRGTDLAVRLHLEGIESGPALPSLRAALDTLPPGDVDVVATYAAFQAVRRELHVA